MKTLTKLIYAIIMIAILAKCSSDDPQPHFAPKSSSPLIGHWTYKATKTAIVAEFDINIIDGVFVADGPVITLNGKQVFIEHERITQVDKTANTIVDIAFSSDSGFGIVFNHLELTDSKDMIVRLPTYTIDNVTTFEDSSILTKN